MKDSLIKFYLLSYTFETTMYIGNVRPISDVPKITSSFGTAVTDKDYHFINETSAQLFRDSLFGKDYIKITEVSVSPIDKNRLTFKIIG